MPLVRAHILGFNVTVVLLVVGNVLIDSEKPGGGGVLYCAILKKKNPSYHLVVSYLFFYLF